MDEMEYLLNAPENEENLRQSMQKLEESRGLRLKVIEQDGEKFVIFPDGVLEQCRIGDVVDMSVENHFIVFKLCECNGSRDRAKK